MSCNCGKPNCGCANLPKVVEIPGEDIQTLFHKVVIPASIGDETTFPPLPGRYYNVFAVYESSGEGYLYSSDGIPTKITDKAELKRLETLLGNEVAERKEADAYLEEKIDNIKGLKYEIVDELPETGEAGIIYLVPKTSEAPDFYDEYLWVNNAFEKIGSTEVKLDDYVLKDEVFNRYNHPSGVKMTDGIKMTPYSDSPASASNGGVAIGLNARATVAGGVALGAAASSTEGGIDAIGSSSNATSGGRAYAGGKAINGGLAIGPGANASIAGIAIGSSSSNKATASGGSASIAIGNDTSSTNNGYEAIGVNSTATNTGRAYAGGTASNSSIAVGGTSNGGASVSFGASSSSTGGASSAIGYQSTASASAATAVGTSAKASAQNSVAMGAGAQATGNDSVAIRGNASYNNAVSIGASAVASSYSAVALGQSAAAKGYNGVAIGPSATVDSSTNSAVAIGYGSRATADATASFGSSSFKRRLVNVAPATADNDAVILSQLNDVEDTLNAKIDGISMAKAPNVTLIGEPTLNNGQASDFSAFDYLQFPFILDLTGKTFVIDFCFTTGNDVTTQQNIIDSKYGIALAIQNGRGVMAISSDGTSWNVGTATGTTNIEANMTYFARLSWDGATYRTDISYDGQSFTKDMSIESVYPPFPTTHYIGGANSAIVGHTTHPFGGIIDLNKSKMIINDELVWEGMDSLGLRTRADVSLSNIDAAGEEKIREVMAPIIGNIEAILAELNSGEGV